MRFKTLFMIAWFIVEHNFSFTPFSLLSVPSVQ